MKRRLKQHVVFILFFCYSTCLQAQIAIPVTTPTTDTSSKNKTRLWLVAGSHAAVWAGSYIALNKAWYAEYPKQSFHTFNDWEEWNQMDKAGHIWTAYTLSRYSTALWQWAGVKNNTAVWLGGASAMAYQSIIEIQDGFSAEWGFSWGDMAANSLGAAAYIAQELAWQSQKIQIKFNYIPYRYPQELQFRRDELFGTTSAERILKDYNAQTYWLSANISSFFPKSRSPKWLNLSLGYSSDLMLGGRENKWTAENGTEYDYTQYKRTRRYYLSVDADLTKIKTRSKFLRGVFFAFNAIKIPAPAVEFNNEGKIDFHWLR